MENQREISILKLIMIPSVITLAVTLLRLTGELLHWPRALFSTDAGGGFALIGISWLAPVFGIYFGVRLAKTEGKPRRVLLGIVTGIVGFLLIPLGAGIAFFAQEKTYPRLIAGLAIMALSGIIQYPVWPRLFKTLLAYAYAARIPVIVVMYFAIQGQWGTHYDALPTGREAVKFTSFTQEYIFLALIPQLIMWIGFTIATGTIGGSIGAALVGRRRQTETAVATA